MQKRLRDPRLSGCLQAGRIAEKLGWRDEVIDFYKKTLQQLPGYREALERLEELTNSGE